MNISSAVTYLLETHWVNNGDPRVQSLPLMYSLRPAVLIVTAYLTFVLWFGPRMMQNRQPFVLRKPLLYYNIFMSGLNAFFFLITMLYYDEILPRMFDMHYPDVHDTSDKLAMAALPYVHLYLLSKFVDLFDTVFFVLRKKQSQVTALHVYHHASVAFLGWIVIRMNFQCNILIPFGLLNSFIHTLMYAYYGLSTFGPAVQKYLWWKRYLTLIQLVQFAIIFVYGLYFICFQKNYPAFLLINLMAQPTLYFVLFLRFYLKTYKKSHGLRETKIETSDSAVKLKVL